MHYAMGLGVAALGLLSALEPSGLATSAPLDSMSSIGPVEGDVDVVVQEGKTIWFNMAWADFLGTDGEWEEEEVGEGKVRMLPVGDDCSFGVRLTWKKQIVYFPMDADCELAFDGDWIKIDQNGRGIVLAPDSEDASAAPYIASDCVVELDLSQIAAMDWDGNCWVSNPTPAPGCSTDVSCGGTAEDHCALRIVHISGTTVEGHNYNEECGSSLGVTECTAGAGRTVVCVHQ